MLNDSWFDINTTYTLVTTSFLAEGHDGFDDLKKGQNMNDEDCAKLLRDVILSFFKRTSADWTFKRIVNSKVVYVDEGY